MASNKHHIVIVGGGFAGIYALQALQEEAKDSDNIEITLINKTDTFVFIPMIHEVATGLLRPGSVLMPLRLLPKKYVRNFIEGTVREIDTATKTVKMSRAEGCPSEFSYDTLILATGSQTNFFGIPGAEEHAYPMRDLDDARAIKNRIIEVFDMADEIEDAAVQKQMLKFVVVGGGPTGIELAAEIGDCLCGELADQFPRLKACGQVILVNRNDRLLAEAGEWFSKKAESALIGKCGVRIMHDTNVEEVTAHGVKTNKGFIEAPTVFWCAGVQAAETSVEPAGALSRDERSRRVAAKPTLEAPNDPDVYVIGDAAAVTDPETGKPYAMRAQFAVEQGHQAARNIIRKLRGEPELPFSYRERGFIISMGKGKGIAKVGRLKFSGLLAWVIYHASYLRSLVGVRAKLRTLFDWTLNLFTARDFSKI